MTEAQNYSLDEDYTEIELSIMTLINERLAKGENDDDDLPRLLDRMERQEVISPIDCAKLVELSFQEDHANDKELIRSLTGFIEAMALLAAPPKMFLSFFRQALKRTFQNQGNKAYCIDVIEAAMELHFKYIDYRTGHIKPKMKEKFER